MLSNETIYLMFACFFFSGFMVGGVSAFVYMAVRAVKALRQTR